MPQTSDACPDCGWDPAQLREAAAKRNDQLKCCAKCAAQVVEHIRTAAAARGFRVGI